MHVVRQSGGQTFESGCHWDYIDEFMWLKLWLRT